MNQTPDVACRATAGLLVGGAEDAVGPSCNDGCWDEGLWVMGREAEPPDKLSLFKPGRPKETERLVRNLSTALDGKCRRGAGYCFKDTQFDIRYLQK